VLRENDTFLFKNVGPLLKKVYRTDDNFFKYSEGNYVAPGMPLFSNEFKI
jgi:hypothetical protein